MGPISTFIKNKYTVPPLYRYRNEIIVEMLTCPLLPLVAESGVDWREHGTIYKRKYYEQLYTNMAADIWALPRSNFST